MQQAESIHSFGDTNPLPKSPTGQYWRVETDGGHYIATFATEQAARQCAARESKKAWRDARVSRIHLVGA